MKPLFSESQDDKSLQALGRASVQIVHDLKNQINGLKLYATFLRKRLEKSERPMDELDTVNKLLAGIDRTAADLSMIAQVGQPLNLKKQPGIDLNKIMHGIASNWNERLPHAKANPGSLLLEASAVGLVGEFDVDALTEALTWISAGACKLLPGQTTGQCVNIQLTDDKSGSVRDGVIEWSGFGSLGHDPFESFVGSEGIRMSLAARVIDAHGGSAEGLNGTLRVRLPLVAS